MPDDKFKSTIKFLLDEMRTSNMNDTKVHVKLEVLLKSLPIENIRAQEGRIIVY